MLRAPHHSPRSSLEDQGQRETSRADVMARKVDITIWDMFQCPSRDYFLCVAFIGVSSA